MCSQKLKSSDQRHRQAVLTTVWDKLPFLCTGKQILETDIPGLFWLVFLFSFRFFFFLIVLFANWNYPPSIWQGDAVSEASKTEDIDSHCHSETNAVNWRSVHRSSIQPCWFGDCGWIYRLHISKSSAISIQHAVLYLLIFKSLLWGKDILPQNIGRSQQAGVAHRLRKFQCLILIDRNDNNKMHK